MWKGEGRGGAGIEISRLTACLHIFLFLISLTIMIHSAHAAAVVRMIPSVAELGDPIYMPDIVGTTFQVAIVIENVMDFYGFDIQMNWRTEYIQYVNESNIDPSIWGYRHLTVTISVENYPPPNPPSPYGGALHKPILETKNVVNESKGIPDADPETMAWFVYAAMAPAVGQDGDATIAILTFKVIDQPWSYEAPADLLIHFVVMALSDSNGIAIPHEPQDLTIRLWQRYFTYPPVPKLDVNTDTTKDIPLGGTFNVEVSIMDINDGPLDPLWDVAGFDIVMHFDPTLIRGLSFTIDPDDWFKGFWPGGIFGDDPDEIIPGVGINNTIGEVKIAFLGIPGPEGDHIPPFGIGRLFTVTFESIFESATYPPPSCVLGLRNPEPRPMPDPLPPPPDDWPPEYFMTDMAGFPHPERLMSPWNRQEGSPFLPHVIENATYIASFKPPGRWIDLITQYPYGFNGRGPNEPSDVFGPQATVRLIAEVTYNFNPVQQKDVSFEISHGEFHWFLSNRTDESGVTWIEFGLPWPCVNPETRVFGTWNATAVVEVREETVNDTISWEVNYLIKITAVEPQPDDVFSIGEHLVFNVTFESVSRQDRNAHFSLVVYDGLQVPIAWFLIGPMAVHYGAGSVFLGCKTVPKHTFVGEGRVYANVLAGYSPMKGGVQYSPTVVVTITLVLLGFEVPYAIWIVSVDPLPDDTFQIDELLSFRVTINSTSDKELIAYIIVVVLDDLYVPIAWSVVGPLTFGYGVTKIIIECGTVPKHAFVGVGHVYTNILTGPPHEGGVQYCPQNITTIILTDNR